MAIIRLNYLNIIFLPVLFYHFLARLADEKADNFWIAIAYFIGFLFCVSLICTNYFISGFYRYYFGFYPKASYLHLFYLIFTIIVAFRGFYLVFRSLFIVDKKFKNQLTYTLLALCIYFIASVDYLVNWGIEFYPVGIVFIAISLSIICFSIVKHELFNISFAITRTLSYGLVFVAISLSVVSSFYFLNGMPLFQGAAMLLLTVFWSFFARVLRRFIQTPLEEKWITDWYDPENLINSIVQKIAPMLSREEILMEICQGVKSSIRIKGVDCFVLNEDLGKGEIEYISIFAESFFSLGFNDSLVRFLLKEKAVLKISSLVPDIRKGITLDHYSNKGVVIPLYSTEILEGFIILDQKVSEDPYSNKDLNLFRTIQNQVMLALDRIRPYEAIKKEYQFSQSKLLETERLLARSEKIASMASLIQEFNHEIRTPLTIINGRVEDLLEEGITKDEQEKICALIKKHVFRIRDIVDTTLRLSKPKDRQEIELDITQVIENALDFMPPDGVELVKEFKAVNKLIGDPEDLQTAFINLIKNAVEAMPDGGELKITTEDVVNDEDKMVIIRVIDAGKGISAENQKYIFDPFFSTNVTKGRGLGLSIVFRIIREHLGKIDVQSEVGKGSVFTIRLAAKVQGLEVGE